MDFSRSLKKALQRRTSLFTNARGQTNAFRLFCGVKEGIKGLVVDRYDGALVVQVYEEQSALSDDELKAIGVWYLDHLPVRSIYLKRFIKDRTRAGEVSRLCPSAPMLGERLPEKIPILENGILYIIRLAEGFSTGLFLDQRENRRFLAERSHKEVLNCFAYTCGFSVACALRGARVTSVDVSKKNMEWGKENFSLNGVDLKPHRFFVEDTVTFYKRAMGKGWKYDLILLDPPSFSRNRDGKVFSIQKDFERLLVEAQNLIADHGSLFFSCHLAGWDSEKVKKMAKAVFAPLSFERIPPPPFDFQWEENPMACFLGCPKLIHE